VRRRKQADLNALVAGKPPVERDHIESSRSGERRKVRVRPEVRPAVEALHRCAPEGLKARRSRDESDPAILEHRVADLPGAGGAEDVFAHDARRGPKW